MLPRMATTTEQGLERFQQAMASLFRHGTLQRFHDHVATEAGIDCERAGFLVMRRVVSEGPIRVTDLARDLGLDPSTISRHLDAVEVRGWVRRLSDPTDRRATLVTASKDGERVVARLEAERRRVLASVLAEWDQTDRDTLFDLTERFASDLTDHIQFRLT
jgi:DNA-binding MarR family transcriptional regulator